MRFGQDLHRFQIAEWAPWYIDYRRLKCLYKNIVRAAPKQGENRDQSDFISALKKNVIKVNTFYDARLASSRQNLEALHNHYGLHEKTKLYDVDDLDLTDLSLAILEIQHALKQLQWYGYVNYKKILDKIVMFAKQRFPSLEQDAFSTVDTKIQYQCFSDFDALEYQLEKIINCSTSGRPSAVQASLLVENDPSEFPNRVSLNMAFQAINDDDAKLLATAIDQNAEHSRLISLLLHRCVLKQADDCFDYMLARNYQQAKIDPQISWLVIKIGRLNTSQRWVEMHRGLSRSRIWEIDVEKASSKLCRMIDRYSSSLGRELCDEDSQGRIPLHYAVKYNLVQVTQCIVNNMVDHNLYVQGHNHSATQKQDSAGLTPLKMAVLNSNAPMTEVLLQGLRRVSKATRGSANYDITSTLGELTTAAVTLHSKTIIQLLLLAGANVNYKAYNDETALYLAVRSGHVDHVATILEMNRQQGAVDVDVDAQEAVRGWTPLMMACIRGDVPSTDLLLKNGADPFKQDLHGWKAKDHAAFRGWEPIALRLAATESTLGVRNLSIQISTKLESQTTFKKTLPCSGYPRHTSKDVPSGFAQIYVSLGALDTYKPCAPVDLRPLMLQGSFGLQEEGEYLVEVKSLDEDQTSHTIHLPIMEDMANQPLRFMTRHPRTFKLAFDIYKAFGVSRSKGSRVGRAIALLDDLKKGLGPGRESLIRDFTIPITETNSLDYVGNFTFYFLVVTQYPQPHARANARQEVQLDDRGKPMIIGHRGIGQNDPSRKQLQMGENTIESFRSAKDLGASYIEFDVQITKDGVPIIYHDFLMSETGIDAPLHTVSLEQFMHVSEVQSALVDMPSMAEKRYLERNGDPTATSLRQRSYSLNVFEQDRTQSLIERMKHTFEFKLNEHKGFDSYKGNIRREYIQSSFMKLEDLFSRLPESFSFDIEIKYPMLFEAHDWGMDPYALEANHVVDTVLNIVFQRAGKRTLFFSSFSPEICILLSRKQDVYPVLFLTESGHIPSADARADSLQDAIHFARAWNLPGVIARSQPLVVSPALVQYVKDSGLLCISWGELNDQPEHAKTQLNAGLDAIIVNSVKLISQTMKKA